MEPGDYLSLVQTVLIAVQIGVVLWVARQWKVQKRSERYADQCHNILKHWYKIEHYFYVIAGMAVYDGKNDWEYSKKFIGDNKDDLLIFYLFLKNPKIYINDKDNDSIRKVFEIEKDYSTIRFIYDEYMSQGGNKNWLRPYIGKYLLEYEYELNSKSEVQKIKESNNKDAVKMNEIFKIYKKDVQKVMAKLEEILLDYFHLKKL